MAPTVPRKAVATEGDTLADGQVQGGSGAQPSRRPGLRDRLELSRGGADRLASMEGLRGLAVLLVFMVHYTDRVLPWIEGTWVEGFASRVGDAGNSGVDLFFVLSGFLIYGNLMRREQAYRPFVRRRLRRIYPTFLVVLAAYVVVSFAIPSESKLPGSLAEIPPYLLFNALLLPGIIPVPAFITVAWSLSYEVFFYLTVPILITRLNLRERTEQWRWRFFVRLALGLVLLGGVISGAHPRMSMFVGGMLLWEWLTYRWPRQADDPEAVRKVDRWSTVALVVGVLSLFVLPGDFAFNLPRVVVLLVAWPVLCAGCFAVDRRCRRWFSWTPLRLLGNVSYSFYLVHSLVLQAFAFGLKQVWPPPSGGAGWLWFVALVPAFAASVAASIMLFLAVEKPLSLSKTERRLMKGARPS